jgi:PAS domain S-box-containing protein
LPISSPPGAFLSPPQPKDETLLRLLADQAPAIIWTTDRELRFTFSMGSALKNIGVAPNQLMGMSLAEYFRTQDPDFPPILHHRRALTGEKTSYEFNWQNRIFHTRVEPFLGPDGKIIGTLGLALDITERKRAEAELQESERRWKAIVSQAPGFVTIMDEEGRILYINRVSPGYVMEDVIGTSTLDFLLPSYRPIARRAYRKAFQKGEIVTYDVEGQITKDRTAWYRSRVGPLYRNGKISSLILVSTDISENKRAEVALKGSFERMRQLAARLQSVREEERQRISLEIHDRLGQALTGLKLDLSSMAPGAGRENRPRFKSILQSLDDTIRAVRKISTELRPAVLDSLGLKAAIEWQAREFQTRTKTTVRLKIPARDIDPGPDQSVALFRIFQEILTNVARHAEARSVQVDLNRAPRELRLTVADNGRGITKKALSDPASLGLLGMRERALPFGGTVDIEGQRGRGTKVTVRLPQGSSRREP